MKNERRLHSCFFIRYSSFTRAIYNWIALLINKRILVEANVFDMEEIYALKMIVENLKSTCYLRYKTRNMTKLILCQSQKVPFITFKLCTHSISNIYLIYNVIYGASLIITPIMFCSFNRFIQPYQYVITMSN